MNEKQVTIITIIVLGVILVLGGVGIYYLRFVKLAEKRQELDAISAQLKTAQDKVNALQALLKENEKLAELVVELEKTLPNLDKSEYDTFADLLDDMRRKSTVFVHRGQWVVPPKPQPVPGRPVVTIPATMHKIQYDLGLQGTFYRLLRFMNLVEQQRRFIGVESFSLAPSAEQAGKGGSSPERDLKVTIFSYTYKTPPAAAPVKVDERKAGGSTPIPQ